MIMIISSRNSVFAVLIALALSACSNAQMDSRNSLSNAINNMPGHIDGHSITLYNKAIQLDKMGNRDAAIRDFRKSADLGNIKAMLRMGTAYAIGYGVLIDRTRAKYWIGKAYSKADAAYDVGDKRIASRIWKRYHLWRY